MPGVVVTTAVRTGPTGVNVAPSSAWFVAGTSERGPIDEASVVNSLAEFEIIYGGYNANFSLHPQVQTFFEEGGARCYVGRAVGPSATAGTKTLFASGAVAALTLTAANPGIWSADLEAEVVASGSTFVIKLWLDDELVYTSRELVDADDAANVLNASSVASVYVTAAVVSGALPLVTAAAGAFSTGVAGGTVTDALLVDALDLFGSELGAGAVSIPGQYSADTYEGLIAHGVTNNRIALLGFNPASDADAAMTTADTYSAVTGAEYAAFFFPHVKIPGAGSTTLTISPEGYAAAKRSLAHNQVGSWRPGAGLISQADFLTGTAVSVDKATGDDLDAARVNAIRTIQGTIRIYGARSVSSDETNWRYITYRDTLNYVVVESERVLEDLVFSPIDGRRTVFGRTEARLIGILDPMRSLGGLFEAVDVDGNQIDPGYSVEVSDALNPVAQLAEGLVRAKVGLRVSSVGDRIEIEIVKSNLTSSVV